MCVIAMTTTPPPQDWGIGPTPGQVRLDCTISLGTGWLSYQGETDLCVCVCVCVHKAVVYFM